MLKSNSGQTNLVQYWVSPMLFVEIGSSYEFYAVPSRQFALGDPLKALLYRWVI